MTAANAGHSALNAETGIRGDMPGSFNDLPDDEARGRFIVAAVEHARQQHALLEEQADAVEAKRDEVLAQWNAKVAEADDMADRAADEVAHWEQLLSDRTGF